jgi:hypothetical protein
MDIAEALERHLAIEPTGVALCLASSEVMAMPSVGLALLTEEQRGPTYGSDDLSRGLEELQFTLGEGPSIDGAQANRPLLEPTLAVPHDGRWSAFAAAATEAGIAAVSAFPLRVGAARIGALTVYQREPGRLSDDQQADGLVLSDQVTRSILTMQIGADPGALAAGLSDTGSHRAEVHQASGMLSVQLGVSIAEALVRLRGHAYAIGRPIDQVAADVVARRLRLEPADGP